MTGFDLVFAESETLDMFLALQRDLQGRFPWEVNLIPTPPIAEIAAFRDAVRQMQAGGVDEMPSWLASASRPEELLDWHAGDHLADAVRHIGRSLLAAREHLEPPLREWDHYRVAARKEMTRLLAMDRIRTPLAAALGVQVDEAPPLPVHLVPFAPHLPGAGFLTDQGRPAVAFVDCRRFSGNVLADCILSLMSWYLLIVAPTAPQSDHGKLTEVLARRLPGAGPYHRRLRAVLTKLMVEYTAGHFIHSEAADHRMCVDLLGSAWRYPRLFAVVQRCWGAYLAGRISRGEALDSLCASVSACHPRWYVDHLDAASLAADFYLMEAMKADGNGAARRLFALWLPQLASYFARQLDMIIGLELAHYERARNDPLPPYLRDFICDVTTEASQVAWMRTRRSLGQAKALPLAAEAFAGPGVEYGGRLWAPVAQLLRRYVGHEISDQVFVDQCFTMEHNNGSLFDKYLLTETMPEILDAQAAGDFDILLSAASSEVRRLWRDHLRTRLAGHSPMWTGMAAFGTPHTSPHRSSLGTPETEPGRLGCGSSDPAEAVIGRVADETQPLRTRDRTLRKPITLSLDQHSGARATLHTSLGDIDVVLWPELAPYSVDNFAKLVRGERDWKDPDDGRYRSGRFYDGTTFFRRIPGFLIQGGDRSETGDGGPGYRVPDELEARLPFQRPFLFAMSNLGTSSTGSQFFITLAPAEHLSGRYNQCGEVIGESSRAVVTAIAVARQAPVLQSVDVVTW